MDKFHACPQIFRWCKYGTAYILKEYDGQAIIVKVLISKCTILCRSSRSFLCLKSTVKDLKSMYMIDPRKILAV